MTNRSFLLLQGVASPFFSELEKGLLNSGHQVLKVNFCGGDLLSGRFFSTAMKHVNFRKKLSDLPDFYLTLFQEHQVTDIVLFGDTRPIHVPAIKLAKKQNILIHVYEEGYFRPNWVTLDRGGVNAHSSLSKDANWFQEKTKNLSQAQVRNLLNSDKTGGSLMIRGWHDIRYHIAKILLTPYFPHYQSHRPDNALLEYWGFLRRIPAVALHYQKKSNKQIKEVIDSKKTFYLLPLQLGADSQIRLHSNIESISEYIEICMRSFAHHAPQDALLIIKNHPLDPWFVNYPEVIQRLSVKYSIDAERLVFLEGGDLVALLEHAKGTVLINSTVGTSSLAIGCPVIALGEAIYDIEGLTFQGNLDDFWTQATPPDSSLFQAFKLSVIEQTQINGSFYNQKGITMAVQNSLPKLNQKISVKTRGTAETVTSKTLLSETP